MCISYLMMKIFLVCVCFLRILLNLYIYYMIKIEFSIFLDSAISDLLLWWWFFFRSLIANSHICKWQARSRHITIYIFIYEMAMVRYFKMNRMLPFRHMSNTIYIRTRKFGFYCIRNSIFLGVFPLVHTHTSRHIHYYCCYRIKIRSSPLVQ